ncbi:ribosomal protein S7 domain-containing protein [Echria macrotheca]|uniref:Small ribosomal subunit protein uS7m n=1 Tax=Echria macrotheca TaxID=438768 RepID=A0AAJ0FDU7_9PEZI|nr:ribosomal protein S7 domain-containing protein [Echria macrotheca]
MPPRPNLVSVFRALSIRPGSLAARRPPAATACIAAAAQGGARRGFATEMDDTKEISETLRAKMNAYMSDDPSGKPSLDGPSENELALKQLELAAYGVQPWDVETEGVKFGIPQRAAAATPGVSHKKRYDPVVEQMTKLLMRDGKLAKAQRDMAMILNYLRSSPPPKVNPARPLLPGAPPAYQLPLDPVLYLTLAIDSVAPLIRIRGYKGLAGGGKSLDLPIPLMARQRRRVAFGWILDVVNKKPSKGSGRTMFPHRVAEEIVAVIEGRSSVWDKRQQVHKQGTVNRANLGHSAVQRFKVM